MESVNESQPILTCMLTPKVQMYKEYTGFRSQVGSSTPFRRPQARERRRVGKERYNATYSTKQDTICSSSSSEFIADEHNSDKLRGSRKSRREEVKRREQVEEEGGGDNCSSTI